MVGGLLLFLVLIGVSEGAGPSTLDPGGKPAEASPAEGDSISVEELARRLQRLEKQNSQLATQNNELAKQNANLNAQSQSLSGKLDVMTKLYDKLNRRLENLTPGSGSTPSLPPATVPSSAERPAAQKACTTPNEPSNGVSPTPDASTPPESEKPSGSPPPKAQSDPKKESSEKETSEQSDASKNDKSASSKPSKFSIGGYDEERGQFILVQPKDPQCTPFELRADVFIQARYTNFAPSAHTWTDSTGTAQPIHSIDSWEMTRNFLQFSGYALDPNLQFTTILFSSTAFNDVVYLGWINYHFSDAFDLRVGNWLVPGTREWYTSFRYTLGADRTMATTFFRPNISPGIWAQGEPIESVHYVAMVANSLNRFSQGIDRIGSSFTFGGTLWWEPLGDFGPGPSDVENHQSLSTRLGVNAAVSREANQGITDDNLPNPEDTILRLSDGTPLFRAGVLGPGVTLTASSVQLGSLDAAFKYRGLSLSGEYFFRWLDHFDTVSRAPSFSSLFDHGAMLQGSCFVVPTKLEPYARTSFVTGRFGTGSEFGGGVNWYPLGSRDWRFTCEVLYISKCPAENLLTGYRAGESGTLVQLQWFTDF
jgi:hypothetical protein